MKRIRSNRGGLYPAAKKQAGYKDQYYEYVCSECGGKILKKESNLCVPEGGEIKRYHFMRVCSPEVR